MWFSSSWNEKKKGEKKKTELQVADWATAHPLALGHDTMVCIMTGKAGCAAKGPTTRPGKATTQPSNVVTRSRGRRDTAGSALSRRLAGGEYRNTKHCIVTGERD